MSRFGSLLGLAAALAGLIAAHALALEVPPRSRGDRHNALGAGHDSAATSASPLPVTTALPPAPPPPLASGHDGAAPRTVTTAGHRQDAAGHGHDARRRDEASRDNRSPVAPPIVTTRRARPRHRPLPAPAARRGDHFAIGRAARLRRRPGTRGAARHEAPGLPSRRARTGSARPRIGRRSGSLFGWRSRSPRRNDCS